VNLEEVDMTPRVLAALAIAATMLAMIAGCGNDESPKPDVAITLSPDSTDVDLCGTLNVVAELAHTEDTRIDWYVNDILGGNAAVGTVTQTNPATYAAPHVMPDPPEVTIKAVPKADTSQQSLCVVTLTGSAMTTIHVSASAGSDETGTGCIAKPFKSITRALTVATPGATVLVAPGIYDAGNGELFPLNLPDSVALVGENWETTIIRGHSETAGYYEAIDISGSNSALRKFTLEQGVVISNMWDLAVLVIDPAENTTLDSIRVSERARYAVARVQGALNTTVADCRFVIDDDQRSNRGFEIVFDDVGTVLRNCTVSGFFTGLFFNSSSDAKVENCTIEGNEDGIELCCLDSENSNPNPDLGGGARGSAGGNSIRNNLGHGLENGTVNTVYAKFNTWSHHPPTVGPQSGGDIYNQGTGSVIWE
jgi:Protein of unknown function (DUF1565)